MLSSPQLLSLLLSKRIQCETNGIKITKELNYCIFLAWSSREIFDWTKANQQSVGTSVKHFSGNRLKTNEERQNFYFSTCTYLLLRLWSSPSIHVSNWRRLAYSRSKQRPSDRSRDRESIQFQFIARPDLWRFVLILIVTIIYFVSHEFVFHS